MLSPCVLVHREAPGQEVVASDQIRQWIDQLADPQFAVRSAASEGLSNRGLSAVGPVAEAVRTSSDVEVQLRGLQILQDMSKTDDSELENAVIAALESIVLDAKSPAKRRAQELQTELDQLRRGRAIAKLRRLGAIPQDGLAWTNPAIFNGGLRNNFLRRAQGLGAAGFRGGIEDFVVDRIVLESSWTGTLNDLEALRHLPEVADVVVDGSKFDNAYLRHLAILPGVNRVLLRETTVDAEGLSELTHWKQLQSLAIWYSPVTDKELRLIETLPSLTILSLRGTGTEEASLDQLRTSRPKLQIQAQRGAFLGVSPIMATGDPKQSGVPLLAVTAGGAAERAGLIPGDTIVAFDGEAVKTFDELRGLIAAQEPGAAIDVDVLRGEERLQLSVELGKWRAADWPNEARIGILQGGRVPQFMPVPAPAMPPINPPAVPIEKPNAEQEQPEQDD